jgi:hypothetical protein
MFLRAGLTNQSEHELQLGLQDKPAARDKLRKRDRKKEKGGVRCQRETKEQRDASHAGSTEQHALTLDLIVRNTVGQREFHGLSFLYSSSCKYLRKG